MRNAHPTTLTRGVLVTLVLLLVAGFATASPKAPAAAASSQTGGPTKYALLIGIDDYSGSGVENLRGAKNDIALMERILVERLGVPSENTTKLLDARATHENIRDAAIALTQKAKPGDMVYAHYAGHGSLACNFHGDKTSGYDPTWVTSGSRQAALGKPGKADCADLLEEAKALPRAPRIAPGELNKFDVLSKELNNLFHELHAKTGNLVVVSDSCHSGTITRGLHALKSRAAPADTRLHPLAAAPAGHKPEWLQISACQDMEEAREWMSGDGSVHGLFTWFWAQALLSASPGETWEDVLKRAEAQILLKGNNAQHPYVLGDKSMRILGGRIDAPSSAIPVKAVADGKVWLAAGRLAGLTPGTVLRKRNLDQTQNSQPTLELTEVSALSSTGSPDAGFAVGDLLEVQEYACQTSPIRVYIRADLQQDAPLVEQVKNVVRDLKAYDLSSSQAECDLVLQILRPKKNPDGAYLGSQDRLPRSFADEPAQCWALTPGEGDVFFFDGQDGLKTALDDNGLKNLKNNLFKLARVRNVINLANAPGRQSPVGMTIDVYEPRGIPPETCPPDGEHFLERKDTTPARCWKKTKSLPPGKAHETVQSYSGDALLRFTVANAETRPYYVYLLNITSKGEIIPLYPEEWQGKTDGLLEPGRTRALDVRLALEESKEYVRLIASREPLDLTPLWQKRYEGVRGAEGSGLELLLDERADRLSRGAKGAVRLKPADWGVAQVFFERVR
jgi:hypothetical protein